MKSKKINNIPEGFPYNGETCFIEGSTNLKDYLMGGFENESRDNQASIVLRQLIEKYGIPQCGRNRAVFLSKKYVIKFPLNDNGEKDNQFESSFISNNTAKGKELNINGFLCLAQERLNMIDNSTINFPEWVNKIDSNQVGYDSKGNLKAYDFADINQKKNYNIKNPINTLITT